jgi:hypothetical protein
MDLFKNLFGLTKSIEEKNIEATKTNKETNTVNSDTISMCSDALERIKNELDASKTKNTQLTVVNSALKQEVADAKDEEEKKKKEQPEFNRYVRLLIDVRNNLNELMKATDEPSSETRGAKQKTLENMVKLDAHKMASLIIFLFPNNKEKLKNITNNEQIRSKLIQQLIEVFPTLLIRINDKLNKLGLNKIDKDNIDSFFDETGAGGADMPALKQTINELFDLDESGYETNPQNKMREILEDVLGSIRVYYKLKVNPEFIGGQNIDILNNKISLFANNESMEQFNTNCFTGGVPDRFIKNHPITDQSELASNEKLFQKIQGVLEVVKVGGTVSISFSGVSGSGKTFTFESFIRMILDMFNKFNVKISAYEQKGMLEIANDDNLENEPIIKSFEQRTSNPFIETLQVYDLNNLDKNIIVPSVHNPTSNSKKPTYAKPDVSKLKDILDTHKKENVTTKNIDDILESLKRKRINNYSIKTTRNNDESSRGHLTLRLEMYGEQKLVGTIFITDNGGQENPYDIFKEFVGEENFESYKQLFYGPKSAFTQRANQEFMYRVTQNDVGKTQFINQFIKWNTEKQFTQSQVNQKIKITALPEERMVTNDDIGEIIDGIEITQNHVDKRIVGEPFNFNKLVNVNNVKQGISQIRTELKFVTNKTQEQEKSINESLENFKNIINNDKITNAQKWLMLTFFYPELSYIFPYFNIVKNAYIQNKSFNVDEKNGLKQLLDKMINGIESDKRALSIKSVFVPQILKISDAFANYEQSIKYKITAYNATHEIQLPIPTDFEFKKNLIDVLLEGFYINDTLQSKAKYFKELQGKDHDLGPYVSIFNTEPYDSFTSMAPIDGPDNNITTELYKTIINPTGATKLIEIGTINGEDHRDPNTLYANVEGACLTLKSSAMLYGANCVVVDKCNKSTVQSQISSTQAPAPKYTGKRPNTNPNQDGGNNNINKRKYFKYKAKYFDLLSQLNKDLLN